MRNDPLGGSAPLLLDGTGLTSTELCRLAEGCLPIGLTADAWERVRQGRDVVEAALQDGKPYYCVTTGIGSQKSQALGRNEFDDFANYMIIAEATNFPGPAYDDCVVRAALIVLINYAATGRLGLRSELVERLLELYRADHMPEVRRATSVGASDLGALAQMSLSLIGRALAGNQPSLDTPFDLVAKEGCSLVNSNAFTVAQCALAVDDCARLAAAFDLATAISLEGFRGNLSYLHSDCWPLYDNPHQLESCQAIASALEGSKLWLPSEWRQLQDPLSFRFAMRINGAFRSAIAAARRQIDNDLSSVCDNPIVSLEARRLVTGVNMDATPLCLVMDTLRQALAMASGASVERSLKVQNPAHSGLAAGLASAGRAFGGVQNLILPHIVVARQARLRGLAAPVLLDCAHGVADGIVDVAGPAPISAERTVQAVDLGWQIVTAEIATAIWACELRGLSVHDTSGPIRRSIQTLRPLLPIGYEGEQVFDIVPAILAVNKLVEEDVTQRPVL